MEIAGPEDVADDVRWDTKRGSEVMTDVEGWAVAVGAG